MNKKALVLAIGAAVAIPCAHAQRAASDPDSVVVLYGKVYPEIVRQKGKGATPAGTPVATFASAPDGVNEILTRNEMESSNSRFGVRGHEKLGGGLRAVWQLETQFLVDSNNTAFAQRDSWVGLKHDRFGTVKLGRFDTPFKEYGDDVSFLGVSSGNFVSTSAVLRRFGFGESNAARFHERRVNAVQYESPDLGPAEFKIQYSTNETDTRVRKPHVWSVGGSLEFGPVTVMAGHEIHWDLFGLSSNVPSAMRNNGDANARSKDRASEVAVVWKLGSHTFEFDYEWHDYKEFNFAPVAASANGRAVTYKNNSWLVMWDARWSPKWRTALHYVRGTAGKCTRVFVSTGPNCVTDGLEGSQISAGVAYHFSRRTFLFFLYQQLRNGKSAIFSTGSQTPNTGEDVTQVAAGIHTSF